MSSARCGGADPCGAVARLTGSFSRMTGADRVRRDHHALAVQCGGGRAGTRRIMSEAPSSDSTIRVGFLLLTFVAESGRPSRLVVSGLRHSDHLAHGGDGAAALFAADEPCGARSPTFFRKQGRRFFKNSFSALSSPLSALSLAISADSVAVSGSWASAFFFLRLVDPGPPRSAEPGRKEAATDEIVRSFSRTSRTTYSLNSSGYLVLVMNSPLTCRGKKLSPSPKDPTHSNQTPPRPRGLHRRHHQGHGQTPPTSHQPDHPPIPINRLCRDPGYFLGTGTAPHPSTD